MDKRVVIADDESIIRLDLKEILEGDGYLVVGEAARGDDAAPSPGGQDSLSSGPCPPGPAGREGPAAEGSGTGWARDGTWILRVLRPKGGEKETQRQAKKG